jgi:hypothetical protein
MSRDSSDGQDGRGLIPGRDQDVSLLHSVQTGSEFPAEVLVSSSGGTRR